jgi:hypothetical protein
MFQTTRETALRATAATFLLGLAALGGGADFAFAAPKPESRYTDLVGERCRWDPVPRGEGRGEEQLKRCPGLGGATALVFLDHAQVALGFDWPKGGRSTTKTFDEVVRSWGLGEKLEWRGLATPSGFEPYAATVRVRVLKDQLSDRPDARAVLAVMKVERGKACVMRFIDVAATKDAYALAREVADGLAPRFACGEDKAQLAGTPTPWAKELLEGR